MRADATDDSPLVVSQSDAMQERALAYEGRCACGIAMVAGWLVPALLLLGDGFDAWSLPAEWTPYAASLVAGLFGGVVVGKIGGRGYLSFRALMLRQEIARLYRVAAVG